MEGEPVLTKRVRSYSWEYFDLISPRKVKCFLCAQEITYSGNTSAMLRHLRSLHPETTPTPAAVPAPGRQAELDEALVGMIVMDAQPFTLVEDKGFRAFVQKLDPTYTLPTRQALKVLVEKKYNEEKENAIKAVEKAEAVSLTADMWSSTAMDGYLGVTCHYINEDMELASFLLGVSHFKQAHTAENLKDALHAQLTAWGLRQKVHCLITDSAANMQLMAKLMELRNVPCFAHSLNVVVKMSLEQTEALAEIRAKARNIVAFFRSSIEAKERLVEIQLQLQKPAHKLILEVDTRWNSTFFMLQRLHEQRELVEAAVTSLAADVTPLSCIEYDTIGECLEVLGPFNLATTELSSEKTVSASKVIPIIQMVQHKLATKASVLQNQTAIELSQHLQHFLNTSCHSENIRVLATATLLDPRYKTIAFGNATSAQNAVARVTAECAESIRTDRVVQSTQLQEASTSSAAGDQDNLWDLLDSSIGATRSATAEVQHYLTEPYLSRGEDPLAYWRTRESVYPSLFKLAKRYLHMPATSVPCERVFSKAGDVVCHKRSRLKPSIIEKILFLNKNL